jgi:anti-sigma factor RsiW
MSRDLPIQEEELHAYVDDALDQSRRRQVQEYLDSHPEEAERIRRYAGQRQALRAALAPIAEEPVPPELNLGRLVEAHRARRRVPWRIAAAVVLAFGVGGAGGWTMRGAPEAASGGIAALAREAAVNYQVYAADQVRPVELPAADSAQLVNWISGKLQRPVALPDLSKSGYRFMGGRLVSTEHGPAGLFLYDDDHGTRVAMLVRPMTVDRDTPMSAHAQGSLSGYAWSDQGLGYSVVAPASVPNMHPLADEVRRQVDSLRGG